MILLWVTIGSAAIYLSVSALNYGIGFPLDDSWIHQTFARSLGENGEWAFRPGIPSAGSTSPLWSALLAVGYLARISPYVWTYLLGVACMYALAILCEWTAREVVVSYQPRLPWVGIFFALEWHLVWAAMSGMETLLHGLIVTTVLVLLMIGSTQYLTMGLLCGLSVWVRPDGVTLLAAIALVLLFDSQPLQKKLSVFARALLGFSFIFVFYLLFNLAIAGTPMPNTFYAKQVEYAAWQARPILERAGELVLQLLTGPALFLIPGVIAWTIKAVKQRSWGRLAALAWCLGYFILYLLRLPLYQHGRYIMPAMPVFFLAGLIGFMDLDFKKIAGRFTWVIPTAWRAALVMLTIGFVALGARSYAEDVAVIESEMVVAAKWINQNIPVDALVAAHDIGALGYFDSHELIDLAGLISPQVIPFMRDEPRLAQYLDQAGADYLAAFPEFYSTLLQDKKIVYSTNSPISQRFNRQNLTVYQWKNP